MSHGYELERFVKGAGLVMKALIEEGEAEIGVKMQQLALAEGIQSCFYSVLLSESNQFRSQLHSVNTCIITSCFDYSDPFI